MAIKPGALLEAITASGEHVRMRATRSPVRGRDFPVVWVCTEDEYEQAGRDPRRIQGIPWPLDAVQEISEQVSTTTG